MKRSPLTRSTPLRRKTRPKRGGNQLKPAALNHSKPSHRSLPPEVRAAGMARSGGRCVACLHSGVATRATDPHHLLLQQRWPQWADEPANLAGLCLSHHADHHAAMLRLSWQMLPPECRSFLALVASVDGEAWAYLCRTYPGAREALGR